MDAQVSHERNCLTQTPWLEIGSLSRHHDVTKHICCPLPKYPIDVERNPILKWVPLADDPVHEFQEVEIDILVGEDYFYDIVGTERITLDNGMYLVQSKFGYIVTGRVPQSDGDTESQMINSVMLLKQSSSSTDVDFGQFWSLEDIGIKDNPYQKDDDSALMQFNSSIRFSKDNRYEVKWPWKPNHPDLPSNYNLALRSLKSLVPRLKRQQNVIHEYDKTIQDQLKIGVIEEVEPDSPADLVHYIPHHAVIRTNNATTKLRVVYNASAKASKDNPSLNECLLRGPVILSDLCGMILRFRRHAVAISCDIEKAFLQVGLQEADRDVTRFLWIRDITKPVCLENIVVYRFCRVPFGYISSPFLLEGTIKHHLVQANTPVAKDADRNFYVDNLISGTDSVEEAIAYYSETKTLFSDISMNIREWYTNSQSFREVIQESDLGKSASPKVLGLAWNTDTDELSCRGFKDHTTDVTTNRTILKSVATVFDPCGYVGPVIVRGKLVVQKLWKQNLKWDSPVDSSLADEYKNVCADLQCILSVPIPRLFKLLGDCPDVEHELHCFCDASGKAYATAIYLRSSSKNLSVAHSDLVFSKVRLAPMKPITLPRLELMGVVVGVRALKFVREEIDIPISRFVVWTDSKCILHWIHSSKIQTVFVENRVKEIKAHSDFEFRYIPTSINPADIPTRGSSLTDLRSSTIWWHGPDFLSRCDVVGLKMSLQSRTKKHVLMSQWFLHLHLLLKHKVYQT